MKEGWEIKKLGEVCEFQGGSQPPKSQFIYEPKEGYVRFLQIRDFASDKNITYIPDSKKNRYCNEDDILLGRYGASVGKVLVNKAGAYNVAVMKTIPDETVLSKPFLFLYLSSDDFQNSLANVAARSAQNGFSKKDIFDFPIALPPLPEQQRIVSILDQAFAAIDKAKANAEQNLKNAKELFESYLQGVFENKGDGWVEKTIGEIGSPKMCKRIFKKETTSDGDIPFYKIGTFGKEPDAFISKELYSEYREKYSFPDIGAVLISASGTIGRRVRYNGELAYFQDSNIVWIDNDESQVLNDYLYEFYGACNWGASKGATISRLYNDNLKRIKISFPKSRAEQQALVRKLDALRAETQKLEGVYQKKMDDLEELKKSILQKAFAGELETEKAVAV